MNFSLAMLIAAVSGFVSLSYEMLFYRAVAIGTGGSAIAFPLLLGAFLLGIALGSRAAHDLCSDDVAETQTPLRAIAGFVVASNILAFLAAPGIAWIIGMGESVGIALLFVTLASGLLGAQFPLVTHYGVAADERAGQNVSYLYFANIIGSTAGSLFTGTVVLDHLTLADTSVALCIIGTVSGIALFAATKPSRAQLGAALGVMVLICGGAFFGKSALFTSFWERLIFQDEHNEGYFVEVVENKHGMIGVDQTDRIFGGGIYDGRFNTSLAGDNLLERAYSLPLFHPNPKRVLMIGLSSGSWAAVVANAPGVEELVVIEINPGYLEVLEKRPNRRVLLESEKVRVVIDDGRRWLMRNPDEKFDAVVSNHSYNWRNLASNLLSVEFNELLKSHMNPGGVYIFNTTGEPRVFRTAMETWNHVVRIQNAAVVMDEEPEMDLELWQQQLTDWRIFGRPAYSLDERSQADAAAFIVKSIFVEDTSPTTADSDLRIDAWEPADELAKRVGDEVPITDDNMGTEWTFFRR